MFNLYWRNPDAPAKGAKVLISSHQHIYEAKAAREVLYKKKGSESGFALIENSETITPKKAEKIVIGQAKSQPAPRQNLARAPQVANIPGQGAEMQARKAARSERAALEAQAMADAQAAAEADAMEEEIIRAGHSVGVIENNKDEDNDSAN